MPGGDGTGPFPQNFGKGRGRMQGFAAGPDGECVCPECGTTTTHGRGVLCNEIKCPKCGALMARKV